MTSSVNFSPDRIQVDTKILRPLGGIVKRTFDVSFASLALLCIALPLAVIVASIKLSSPGPAFFLHERIGYTGRRFYCIKLRTMVVDSEDRLQAYLNADPAACEEFVRTRKLRKDPRIIPGIGNFLRKTSLDELPQFMNVFLGHMSVVGPRPVTDEEVVLYGEDQWRYIRCRPGITGLWQVSGRNELSFDERVQIDVAYVDNWAIWRDMFIILRTLKVFTGSNGAY